MKKIGVALIFLGVFLAIGVGFYYGINQFATTSTSEYFDAPVFGYLRCEESAETVNIPSDGFKQFSEAYITCQSGGDSLAQGCDVTFDLPSYSEASGAYSQLCVVKKKLSDTTEPNACTLYKVRVAYTPGAYADQLVTIHVNKDEYLLAQYQEGSLLNALAVWNALPLKDRGLYQITLKPFYIYRYDVFSRVSGEPITNPDTQDCTFSGTLTNTNDIVESISGGELDDEYGEYAIGVDSLRSPGLKLLYISKFVPISTYNMEFLDENTYCQDKRIYEVTEVTTTRGTYKIADIGVDNQIDSVECCTDGDAVATRGAGYYCDDNFEIQKYDGEETCRIDSDCSMGSGYVPGIDGNMYYQECVSGVCVTDYITPECITSYDCPNDQVCKIDSLNPLNNECKGQDILDQCGYNGCQASLGETIVTCPQDCDPDYDDGIPDWLVYSLLGAGVLAVLAALAAKRKGGSGPISL